jgi:hypothetical protein
MNRLLNATLWLGSRMLVCLLFLGMPSTVAAQGITTGSIAGVVTDAQGGVLPGATVTAVHTPTGTSYEGVTDGEGRYNILNVRVGPYDITTNMSGFRAEKSQGIIVKLGEQATLDFKLQVATVSETIEVRGESLLIDPTRAGTADNVSTATIESLPTINRSLVDMARTSPYFNPIGLNEDPLAVSVAGRNNRYNNVQIDGAVNNDLFGLAASGTPGGQTETQPISLDAIQELQLVVSPYDVRQGGFSGGGINAITRSGSNSFRGTGYFFGRNQDLVGDGVSQTPIAEFNQNQFGASLGGPLVQNKAFFFGNVDFDRRDNPSGVSVSSSGQTFGREAEVDRFISILQSRYGYNPGGKEEFIRTINSDKFFVRSDFNLSSRHQLTARHNYNDSLNDIGRPSVTAYYMPDAFYQITNKTNSTVVQLNSTFGTVVNEARFTYQRIRDRRGGQPTEDRAFPFVQVNLSSGTIRAGRENFSTANELDQDVLEFTNDLTWLRGNHTLTIGTHNEFFQFRNLFIRDSFGNYTFDNLDFLEQGLAQSYSYSFSLTGDPQQAAKFAVRQYGFYLGDQWRPRNDFTLTVGVRADIPTFPDRPTRNPLTETALNLRTDEVPSGVLWSPRVGFNYALSDDGREQLRGGLGLFSGRTPYVWLSNQYGNTGIEFQRISVARGNGSQRIPFNPDINSQPTNIGSAATNEINLIDPDYTYPSLFRGNLAYDRALGFLGLVGTAELLYSKNVNDIKYQNLNMRQVSTRPDGRPVFARDVVPGISDLIFLTNTDEGDAWSIAFKLERPFRDRFFANVSYLYGESRSILDGTSSQARSNWVNVYVPGDTNNPPLRRSNFDPGHRVTASASYQVPMPAGFTATAAAFYSGQSGRPWSANYAFDYNGDGGGTNDLLYIPASATEPGYSYASGTYDDLMAFVNAEECLSAFIGKVHERNACRSPWQNTFDFKFNLGLPIKRAKIELTWDVLNVLNLIDSESGVLEYANFNDLLVVRPSFNSNGTVTYDLRNLFVDGVRQDPSDQFTRNDLLSRWQMQFGARIRF